MALVNSDDETTKRNQVLGPQKSKALSILGPGLITGASDDHIACRRDHRYSNFWSSG
jgi:hypothetical protein